MNLDFGVIYYSYPGADDFLAERRLRGIQGRLQLVRAASELGDRHDGVLLAGLYVRDRARCGLSKRWLLGRLPQFHVFTPVINGVLGWQKGDSDDGYFVNVNGTDDEYYYWNAGLGADRRETHLRLPLLGHEYRRRRWPIRSARRADLCDERFVFTAKVVLP